MRLEDTDREVTSGIPSLRVKEEGSRPTLSFSATCPRVRIHQIHVPGCMDFHAQARAQADKHRHSGLVQTYTYRYISHYSIVYPPTTRY
jgi:hypothetical protein